MNAEPSRRDELYALMTEALNTCLQLQSYTSDNFQAFIGDDDQKILEVIAKREDIIEKLIGIEYKVDLILEDVDDYENGRVLPADIDEIRRSVRQILGSISTKDYKVMEIVSSKMQAYKTETLKVRNKKNISAYMKTAYINQPGDTIDFSK